MTAALHAQQLPPPDLVSPPPWEVQPDQHPSVPGQLPPALPPALPPVLDPVLDPIRGPLPPLDTTMTCEGLQEGAAITPTPLIPTPLQPLPPSGGGQEGPALDSLEERTAPTDRTALTDRTVLTERSHTPLAEREEREHEKRERKAQRKAEKKAKREKKEKRDKLQESQSMARLEVGPSNTPQEGSSLAGSGLGSGRGLTLRIPKQDRYCEGSPSPAVEGVGRGAGAGTSYRPQNGGGMAKLKTSQHKMQDIIQAHERPMINTLKSMIEKLTECKRQSPQELRGFQALLGDQHAIEALMDVCCLPFEAKSIDHELMEASPSSRPSWGAA